MDRDATEMSNLTASMGQVHLGNSTPTRAKMWAGARRKNYRGGKKVRSQRHAPSPPRSKPSIDTDFTIFDTKSTYPGSNSTTSSGDPAPLCEIRPSPTAGYGLFATTSLPRGTRIFSESPLMVMPPDFDNDIDELYTAFRTLSMEAQASILSLFAMEDSVSASFRAYISSLIEHYQRNPSPELYAHFLEAAEQHKLGSALFPIAARLNHSCLPNTNVSFNHAIVQLTVHAMRDIDADEELKYTYLGSKTWYTSREQRQGMCENWGFQCECKACREGEEGERHDRVRGKLLTNQGRLQWMEQRASAEALEMCLESIVFLEQEEGGKEVARLRRKAAELCHALRRDKAALLHAHKGLITAQTCLGKDNPEFRDYEIFVQKMREDIQYSEAKARR
ncbi:SET domain-containing protein [Lepidopterella palustris CBS 459.81]|uniref:SET domain-containing protein n=1 Tax=Lepidopterella palustris CBS 459.81 TaxID=1314670 RepID=A0A8E2JFJ8_9PEZI|nr:SET domain-containing protein [Lepidopterella palustris CBS 459.81]